MPTQYHLHIPDGNEKICMNVKDTLQIHIDGACSWCHDGASGVFTKGFLKAGNHDNTEDGGTWEATAAGTVGYDAIPGTDKTCNATLKVERRKDQERILSPAHTITVS